MQLILVLRNSHLAPKYLVILNGGVQRIVELLSEDGIGLNLLNNCLDFTVRVLSLLIRPERALFVLLELPVKEGALARLTIV